MRRLKIALLSRWYWEESHFHYDEEGGATRQLAEAVAALGHEVVVLSQSPEVRKLKKVPVGALETWVSPRGKYRNLLTGLRDKWAKQTYRHRKVYSDALDLRDFLARRGPFDLLWAQCEEPDGLVAAIAARRGVKLPPVLTQIQSPPLPLCQHGVPVFNEKPALSLAFRQATRIIANSELVAHSSQRQLRRTATSPPRIFQAKVRVVYPNLQRQFLQSAAGNFLVARATAMSMNASSFSARSTKAEGRSSFSRGPRKTEAAKRGATFAVIGDFTEKNPDFTAALGKRDRSRARPRIAAANNCSSSAKSRLSKSFARSSSPASSSSPPSSTPSPARWWRRSCSAAPSSPPTK